MRYKPYYVTHPLFSPCFATACACSVTKGMDAVRAIETVKTDKHDRPLEEVKILSIDIK